MHVEHRCFSLKHCKASILTRCCVVKPTPPEKPQRALGDQLLSLVLQRDKFSEDESASDFIHLLFWGFLSVVSSPVQSQADRLTTFCLHHVPSSEEVT